MTSSGIALERLDHLVLTVRDIEATSAFYEKVLGMRRETFGEGRTALHYGRQKINLHPHPSPIDPKAAKPDPGSADLCFVAATPLEQVIAHLETCGVAVELGPVPRSGAQGPMTSVYFRDPNDNLIEVSNYGRE
ncbi:MAG: VOC family protein [Rhodospirillales bacterium]|nr:VOC family protein [Rhodospirillales bacterium]MDH3912071.1 VOC family protein [Rhodospirillales bacterium]MDH3920442.1 VOC family protein [Rhodospirillales bacterium]MDH3968585.1 VOC family protein [Rhodospirillales bacterium]